MPAYGDFARIYDGLMADFDYPAWAEHYLALLRRAGVAPKTMADCACGTGNLTIPFAQMGIRKVMGLDISEEMLSVAQEKARIRGVSVPFVQQDMAALQVPRRVDAITCGCDGVNYLTTKERLNAFFTRACASLRDGGALAFDVSTPFKLQHKLGDGFFGEDRDEVTYLWWNRWDEETKTVSMELTFFVPEQDGRYRRFDERHTQRAWDRDELHTALQAAGFTNIQFYSEFGFDPPKGDDLRMHVTAVRAHGG